MFHRLALASVAIVAVALIALSLVWPQGQGAVSPAPFNRPLAAVERTVTVGGRPVSLRGHEAPDLTVP